ncbi:MerR family transcriptional regulator [Micromonospora sp. DR5-3]|uniref:DNA polymerase III subunit beta family protein n=1 Tax=unclassified Micromonospora TaxID=2617518 RepID=UPI0011DA0128|nr:MULTISPECIES: MerR family transcriptional regulator [unclassified Micromonospora]MCW3814103.1 MerR family transcriptional regulator [Micromonospora sp. DR5-3]TYC25158.1 MerR family transcriptional regulator [Micromonospora sp. MP36]
MRSIGELARASGLTVSALRFYDRSGVLVPALVDPATGYRWYTDDQVAPARLVAGLRRVGMPLAGIAEALRHRHEPAVVHRLLDAHLRRLEDGLADARRELSRIRTLVDPEEIPMTTRLVLDRGDLAAAVDAVRFAVGTDPDLPVLAGVLLEVEADGVRLVATDRHRLAVARAAGKVDGPEVRALLPADAVDELRGLLDTGVGITPEAHLTIAHDRVEVSVAGRAVAAAALPYDFPDYRRLLHGHVGGVPAYRIPVDVVALRGALTAEDTPLLLREYAGVPVMVTVLGVDGRGGLRVVQPAEAADPDTVRVGVNREYLLDALDAGDRGQLVMELDGPITPLAVRRPDDADAFSILMPIRL